MRFTRVILASALALTGCVAKPSPPYPYAIHARAVPYEQAIPPPPPPTKHTVWQPGEWKLTSGTYLWVPGHYTQRVSYHRHWIARHLNSTGQWVPGHWS